MHEMDHVGFKYVYWIWVYISEKGFLSLLPYSIFKILGLVHKMRF